MAPGRWQRGGLGRALPGGGLARPHARALHQRHEMGLTMPLTGDLLQASGVLARSWRRVSMDGNVAVKRVTCAVDCGVVINPNTIEAQVQSAIVYGLTAALYSEITLKDGRVEKSNFDTYRALRINEMPVI